MKCAEKLLATMSFHGIMEVVVMFCFKLFTEINTFIQDKKLILQYFQIMHEGPSPPPSLPKKRLFF